VLKGTCRIDRGAVRVYKGEEFQIIIDENELKINQRTNKVQSFS
jgi:hypothetical protein